MLPCRRRRRRPDTAAAGAPRSPSAAPARRDLTGRPARVVRPAQRVRAEPEHPAGSAGLLVGQPAQVRATRTPAARPPRRSGRPGSRSSPAARGTARPAGGQRFVGPAATSAGEGGHRVRADQTRASRPPARSSPPPRRVRAGLPQPGAVPGQAAATGPGPSTVTGSAAVGEVSTVPRSRRPPGRRPPARGRGRRPRPSGANKRVRVRQASATLAPPPRRRLGQPVVVLGGAAGRRARSATRRAAYAHSSRKIACSDDCDASRHPPIDAPLPSRRASAATSRVASPPVRSSRCGAASRLAPPDPDRPAVRTRPRPPPGRPAAGLRSARSAAAARSGRARAVNRPPRSRQATSRGTITVPVSTGRSSSTASSSSTGERAVAPTRVGVAYRAARCPEQPIEHGPGRRPARAPAPRRSATR